MNSVFAERHGPDLVEKVVPLSQNRKTPGVKTANHDGVFILGVMNFRHLLRRNDLKIEDDDGAALDVGFSDIGPADKLVGKPVLWRNAPEKRFQLGIASCNEDVQ